MARGDKEIRQMIKDAKASVVKKVSAGQMFAVTTVVDEAMLDRMKRAPELAQQTMQDAAFQWHSGILPEHFKRESHGRYGYAARSQAYLKTKGASPDLMRTGAMKAELLSRATAKKKGTAGVELRMTARALNFVPNSGNPFDVKILRNDGKHYPNMKRELRELTDEEAASLKGYIEGRLFRVFYGY